MMSGTKKAKKKRPSRDLKLEQKLKIHVSINYKLNCFVKKILDNAMRRLNESQKNIV
jgi:hypothetical protein